MALSDDQVPETLVWLMRDQHMDGNDKSGSIIKFRLRSNSKNQEISYVPVEIIGEEFMHDDFKSYDAILQLALSSSLEFDYRIRDRIIADIVDKTREILPVGVKLYRSNKRWLVEVEIENNGIGFPSHKLCSNCFEVLPPGSSDTCETCLLLL